MLEYRLIRKILQHYAFPSRPIIMTNFYLSFFYHAYKMKKKGDFSLSWKILATPFLEIASHFIGILIILINGINLPRYSSSRSFVKLWFDRCADGVRAEGRPIRIRNAESVSSFPRRHSIGQAHHRWRSYLHRAGSKPPISITDTAPLFPVTGLEQRCYHDVAETITVD